MRVHTLPTQCTPHLDQHIRREDDNRGDDERPIVGRGGRGGRPTVRDLHSCWKVYQLVHAANDLNNAAK